MIVGIGTDLCVVSRFGEMVQRRPGLLERLLNERERATSIASQAGRFAAKEALAKALGAPGGMSWQDCTVERVPGGAPIVHLRATVAARAAELGITHWHLSISHDAGIASARSRIERSTSSTAVGPSCTTCCGAAIASRKLGKWQMPSTLCLGSGASASLIRVK